MFTIVHTLHQIETPILVMILLVLMVLTVQEELLGMLPHSLTPHVMVMELVLADLDVIS